MTGAQGRFGFPSTPPAAPESVRLLLGHVREALELAAGVGLVHADPPWSYGTAVARDTDGDDLAVLPYGVATMSEIADTLDQSFDVAAPDSYLLCWSTFPTLADWLDEAATMRWQYVTGGAWVKYTPTATGLELGAPGIGYHWRGDAELLLVYRKGRPAPLEVIRNAHATRVALDELGLAHLAPRGRHSEKPIPWLEELLGAFCPAGAEVLDLYSGLAPLARACVNTGRRYLGAEIDPERHAASLSLLAQHRGHDAG